MFTFQDRHPILDLLCDPAGKKLLVISGETGIGKTRLLKEAALKAKQKNPKAIVLFVDFSDLISDKDPPSALLKAIIDQAKDLLKGAWYDKVQVARQVATQLNALADDAPVYLLFDTTDALQEDKFFWPWFEANLLSPLVYEAHVKIVLAGRIAPPLHRLEVRRGLSRQSLSPIQEEASRALVREVLQDESPSMKECDLEQAIDVVLEASFGHPLLSEKVAAYVAHHFQGPITQAFRENICQEIVQPFVQDIMLSNINPPWGEIFPWITILRWFDTTILESYLKRVVPWLTHDQPDYFFTQGITELRKHDRVIWEENVAYHVLGVLGDIIRHCIMIQSPNDYRHACLSAAATFQEIANDCRDDEKLAQSYLDEVHYYKTAIDSEGDAQ